MSDVVGSELAELREAVMALSEVLRELLEETVRQTKMIEETNQRLQREVWTSYSRSTIEG